MIYLIGQIIFCLLIAFLIGLILGWVFSRARNNETQTANMGGGNSPTDHTTCEHKIAELHGELDQLRRAKDNLEEQLSLVQEAQVGSSPDSPPVATAESSEAKPDVDHSIDWETAYEVAIQRAAKIQYGLKEKANPNQIVEQPEDPNAPPLNLFRTSPDHRDDLERIKGIGPSLHRMLNQLGIYQFQQIANFTERDIQWVASNLKAFKSRVTQDNWVAQAATLDAASKNT